MKNRREIKILEDTLKVIDSPEKWTKYYIARKADKTPTQYYSEKATCWCIQGAIRKAMDMQEPMKTHISRRTTYNIGKALRKHIRNQSQNPVTRFNDNTRTTYTGIIRLIKKAIGSLKTGNI